MGAVAGPLAKRYRPRKAWLLWGHQGRNLRPTTKAQCFKSLSRPWRSPLIPALAWSHGLGICKCRCSCGCLGTVCLGAASLSAMLVVGLGSWEGVAHTGLLAQTLCSLGCPFLPFPNAFVFHFYNLLSSPLATSKMKANVWLVQWTHWRPLAVPSLPKSDGTVAG
jgi:hypothetical protein